MPRAKVILALARGKQGYEFNGQRPRSRPGESSLSRQPTPFNGWAKDWIVNFYKHHIGDYASSTAHLSLVEHGAYLLMLQHYYATEQPLPLDAGTIARIIRANGKTENAAIESVLRQFWHKTPEGYIQHRAAKEMDRASLQRETNREIGKRGGRPITRDKKITDSVSEKITDSVIDSVPEREPNDNPSQTPDSRLQTPDVNLTPPPGGGAAKPPTPKRAAQIAPDFRPNANGVTYAEQRRVALAIELESFRNWHTAKGTTMKDWQAAWRTWCDKAVEFGRANGARASPQRTESIHDKRARAMAELTGHRRTGNERNEIDITGEAIRVA